ncbi:MULTISPECIES: hypothetical protein [Streptomyces]|uniref:Uncharacterized protein n=1 Tax=Streptomyces gilvifuscus TaxID=1550617 RepID=A0ABT5FNU3_9ACTN|nr:MULTISPECIES: hypothetical protein [Streptomyces]MBK3640281.1 hypothetical protein [Streptomyces sp. MBT33]MDC2954192.1 hypothetical protein [Streptomyces gilvifuscus]
MSESAQDPEDETEDIAEADHGTVGEAVGEGPEKTSADRTRDLLDRLAEQAADAGADG